MTFEIESGIDIPTSVRNRGSKYPFDKMEVNQSFFVGGKSSSSLYQSARRAAEKTGYKFTVRNWVEEYDDGSEEEGVRIWRVA